jgi:hypothetical protein
LREAQDLLNQIQKMKEEVSVCTQSLTDVIGGVLTLREHNVGVLKGVMRDLCPQLVRDSSLDLRES